MAPRTRRKNVQESYEKVIEILDDLAEPHNMTRRQYKDMLERLRDEIRERYEEVKEELGDEDEEDPDESDE